MASLQKTLDGIQHLRWWAAAIVVLYHLSRLDIPSFADLPYRLAIAGNLGVQIFFVISGFIITIICLDSENKAKLSPGVFATRRLTRIVPIMWIATGSYFLLRYLGTGTFDWVATCRTFCFGQMARWNLDCYGLSDLSFFSTFYSLWSFWWTADFCRYFCYGSSLQSPCVWRFPRDLPFQTAQTLLSGSILWVTRSVQTSSSDWGCCSAGCSTSGTIFFNIRSEADLGLSRSAPSRFSS